MSLTSWLQWLKGALTRGGRVQHHRPQPRTVTPRRSFVPRLDVLEDRTVPSGMQGVMAIGDHGSPSYRPDAVVKSLDAAVGANLGVSAAPGNGLNSAHALNAWYPGNYHRPPDLGPYQDLKVLAGNKVALHVYARGVQIYRWDGATWNLVAPEATLYADRGAHRVVGTHYAGPTWEGWSGSKVVGTVLKRATPDPNSIDWLLLKAKTNEGPGLFGQVTYIQRVNTVGGKAPTTPGTQVGQEVRVPYSAEYYFYRANH